eukprot:Phypoly_transcript_08456.p1 GENE.Phypoly_transcript_08456~~Phypoly_transcript_08456.p1  ORF type:complete len:291 (-),score=43.89 Phypoly_transcript_08456:67-939(-)
MKLVLLVLSALVGFVVSKYVPTPGGTYAWKDCIHTIPDDSHIIEEQDGAHVVLPNGNIFQVPKCDYPPIPKKEKLSPKQDGTPDGWQVYTFAEARRGYKSFTGTFNVPLDPQDWPAGDDAVIYLFTGLEDTSGSNIIQPVLQYGNDTEDGGGKYWALADWWVYADGTYLVSEVKKVNSGDVVFGNMTQIAPKTWTTSAYVVNNPTITTNLTVTKLDLESVPHAYCTLEVYNIAMCSYFPKSGTTVTFANMTLYESDSSSPQKVKWINEAVSNGCKAKTEIKSDSEVEIIF